MNSVKRSFHIQYLVLCLLVFVFVDQAALLFFGNVYQLTHRYGWIQQARQYSTKVQDSEIKLREVNVFYPREGFKRYPEKDAGKPRILIIGDSFTDMNWVSNGEEWYAYLESSFPEYQFFVSGNSGYGTLQELMLLNDNLEEIDPIIVILQTCSNDFVNNNYAAERRMYPHNNFAWRPFFEFGSTVYRLPLPFSWFRQQSFCVDRYMNLFDQVYRRSISRREFYSAYAVSTADASITKGLIEQMAHRVSGRKFMLVEMCSVASSFAEVCDDLGLDCILDIRKRLLQQSSERQFLLVENRHFNLLGNKLVGQMLVDEFDKRF